MTSTNEFADTRTIEDAPGCIVEGATFADRYAIERRLGQGAYAVVYAALDIGANPPQRVALKVARAVEFGEENLGKEAEAISRIHQRETASGVVRLVEPDVQHHGNTSFLVLEYVEGPTLRDLGIQSRLTPNDILDISRALARTLSAVHDVGFVIADVKPDNIVLREGREPVLVDFGAARAVGERVAPGFLTPAYAAPEQLVGGPAVPASDVYALAITLDELMRHSRLPRIASLVANCMAADPTSRPSALAFGQAFEQAYRSLARKRLLFRIFVIAVLLAGLTVTITPFVRMPSSNETAQPPKASLKSMLPSLPNGAYPNRTHFRPSLQLALGERGIYWIEADRLYRSSFDGGNPEIVTYLPEGRVAHIAVASSTIYIQTDRAIWTLSEREYVQLATYSISDVGIAADDQGVAWADGYGGNVSILGPGGAPPKRVLATGQPRPIAVALDHTHVYWLSQKDASIARVSREGGVVEVLVPGRKRDPGHQIGMALDETHVYWLDSHERTIMRIPKRGGTPQAVVQTARGCTTLAMNDTHLYWSCYARREGEIWRLSKVGTTPELLALTKETPVGLVVRGNDVFYLNLVSQYEGDLMRLTVE